MRVGRAHENSPKSDISAQISPGQRREGGRRRGIGNASGGTATASVHRMLGAAHRPIALALTAGVVLTAWSRTTHGADGDTSAAASAALRQEWIGLELTPASMSIPSGPCCNRPGGVDRYQAGFGGSVRLLRYRWEHAYIIPIQVGLYVSSGNETIFAHVETEGGVIVGAARRLELGLGAGVGALAMRYGTGCDGTCNLGGAGWLVSLAARYLFIEGPKMTVGAGARLVVPLGTPDGEFLGYFIGDGMMILGAIEVGFGRS